MPARKPINVEDDLDILEITDISKLVDAYAKASKNKKKYIKEEGSLKKQLRDRKDEKWESSSYIIVIKRGKQMRLNLERLMSTFNLSEEDINSCKEAIPTEEFVVCDKRNAPNG